VKFSLVGMLNLGDEYWDTCSIIHHTEPETYVFSKL
jgi:hypothetical protein